MTVCHHTDARRQVDMRDSEMPAPSIAEQNKRPQTSWVHEAEDHDAEGEGMMIAQQRWAGEEPTTTTSAGGVTAAESRERGMWGGHHAASCWTAAHFKKQQQSVVVWVRHTTHT